MMGGQHFDFSEPEHQVRIASDACVQGGQDRSCFLPTPGREVKIGPF
jgi:hypothetical protein